MFFWRIFLVAIANLVYGLISAKLQLSTVMIIINTAPISVMLLNWLIYKIPMTKLDIIAVIIAFTGLNLVVNPLLFTFTDE